MRPSRPFPRSLVTRHEFATLSALKSPIDVQGFVDSLRPNREEDGETLQSVRETLRSKTAHCIEAALVAAAALWTSGKPPLLVDLRARNDDDHVIAVFRDGLYWGAISKSSHATLRYRDPVYRSIRELVMSYFHEYINSDGQKTLVAYSRPFDVSRFSPQDWLVGGRACWEIGAKLDDLPHVPLASARALARLRPLDPFSRQTLLLREDDQTNSRFGR